MKDKDACVELGIMPCYPSKTELNISSHNSVQVVKSLYMAVCTENQYFFSDDTDMSMGQDRHGLTYVSSTQRTPPVLSALVATDIITH